MLPALFDDPSDLLSRRIVVDGADMSLGAFLTFCLASSDSRTLASESTNLNLLRRIFLDAGVRALEAHAGFTNWVQFGLTVEPGQISRKLYGYMADVARELLQDESISNFFFMYKPPGIRIRFEANKVRPCSLADDLFKRLAVWQEKRLFDGIVPGIYEPETYLFGGPVSMRSVHELFTIDSLAWLDYHIAASKEEVVAPAWALSLVMLRALFTGLGITDWEDLDVWDRLRRRTGRSLPSEVLPEVDFASAAAEIRFRWLNPQSILEELSQQLQNIAERYRKSLIDITARWQRDYFATNAAYIGPRAGAALFTIFHWNRATLSLARQALLAEALLTRQTV
jgi:thiopeptide-type bacteriocin biosynthesis protein